MKTPFQKIKDARHEKLNVGSDQPPVEISIDPTPVEIVEKPHKKLAWMLLGGCVAFVATMAALTAFHIFILPLIA